MDRTFGLARENAALVPHQEGFAEKQPWKELQIESYAPYPFFRQRCIEVDSYLEAAARSGSDTDSIRQSQIRIIDRIEAGAVLRGIGVRQRLRYGPMRRVDHPLHGCRHGRPLPGRRLEP